MSMKLSHYAKQLGVTYRTAWNWYNAGKLSGYQTPTGTIIVTETNAVSAQTPNRSTRTVVYARVSAAGNKSNLESQTRRLLDYCAAKGYQVEQVVREIGSGVNDRRPGLLKLLRDESVGRIVVEHKDRLTRFGFNYLEALLKMQGREIEVINLTENGKEDLVEDFVAIVTSFCARLYGQGRSKRKTERLIAELQKSE
ncbi:MAG: IS607 family transposase [Blastocatellales bacterium]|nr:IS607 family transposase [Blastocatellales bacterium]